MLFVIVQPVVDTVASNDDVVVEEEKEEEQEEDVVEANRGRVEPLVYLGSKDKTSQPSSAILSSKVKS